MTKPVGFRFSPTDEEILDHYLRLKNLGGSSTTLVDKAISTVDISSFDPWELPPKSRRESRDQVWYFFGCKKNQHKRGERQRRKTKSGFWKKTGDTLDIKRKSGNREKMGEKRVLVFHSTGSKPKSKSEWVMHEYVSTFLSPPNQMTFTVCKVMFKGHARDLASFSSGTCCEIDHDDHSLVPRVNKNPGGPSTGSEGVQSLRQFNGLLDEEKETQIDEAIHRVINNLSTHDKNYLFNIDVAEEQSNLMFMQEDRLQGY